MTELTAPSVLSRWVLELKPLGFADGKRGALRCLELRSQNMGTATPAVLVRSQKRSLGDLHPGFGVSLLLQTPSAGLAALDALIAAGTVL